MNGMNIQALKVANRSSVLYLLNRHKVLSRKEIASLLGLTPAGVTKICQSLIDEGYITEGEAVADTGKSGRREIELRLKTKDKYVLGINAEKNKITYSYSNLAGELLFEDTTSFENNIDVVVSKAKCFLNDNGIKRESLFAVGVCVIGSLSGDYALWQGQELKDKLEAYFSCPVAIENNVKAFAQSELIYGNIEENQSLLFLKWGPGIGSSIAANGMVLSGDDNGVAEIGHYIVDAGGEKCRCGRFGCLETVASTDAIKMEINKDISISDLVSSTDSGIINILDHKIDLVALTLTNTATILNADNIVLFGEMFKNDNISEKLIKQCVRYNSNLSRKHIRVSALNNSRDYIGTTAIAAKHFYFEREV